MPDQPVSFPVAKLVSLIVVVALLALPIVSCGPIQFIGHEILRNKPPDLEGLTRDLEGLATGLGKAVDEINNEDGAEGGTREEADGEADGGEPTSNEKKSKERKELFLGGQRWMHWLYALLALLAVATFFVRAASKPRAWLGVAGAAMLILFLSRFEAALRDDAAEAPKYGVLSWDTGAYIALIGFAFMIFEAAIAEAMAKRSRTTQQEAPPPDDLPPPATSSSPAPSGPMRRPPHSPWGEAGD